MPAAEPRQPLPEDLVRPWILPAVYERLRTGRGEFLAELRPAIPVFVQFAGIDYDDDDDAAAKLDDFVRRAQRICADYGGNLLQITIGDKGAYLYAVFGSPHAHEDDARTRRRSRARAARARPGHGRVPDLKIGIAHGRLRSGTYGHAMRRTFVCLGDAVNLAARLMAQAPAGHVYVGERPRRIWPATPSRGSRCRAEREGQGRARRRLLAHRLERRTSRAAQALRARDRRAPNRARGPARPRSTARSSGARQRRRHLGGGGPRQVAPRRGVRPRRPCRRRPRRLRRVPGVRHERDYFVWQEIWRTLLRVDELPTDDEQRLALERELEAIDPALVQRAPLLGPLLGHLRSPTTTSPQLRRQAAQDVARRPAGGLPASSRGRGARS